MLLHCPHIARGCFAASEAASQPPIGVKWYYEESTSDLKGTSGPPALGPSVGRFPHHNTTFPKGIRFPT